MIRFKVFLGFAALFLATGMVSSSLAVDSKAQATQKTETPDKVARPDNKLPPEAHDDRWIAMEKKRKERYIVTFQKLDKNNDRKLTFVEFLSRFGTVEAIAAKPAKEREHGEQRRLDHLKKTFATKFDVDKNGTIEYMEFMTRYYKPLRRPEVVKAEKAKALAAREKAERERERKAIQRDIEKRKRELDAERRAAERAKEAREKSLDRPKADRDRDE